jgi:hypothetical protein
MTDCFDRHRARQRLSPGNDIVLPLQDLLEPVLIEYGQVWHGRTIADSR